MSGMKKGDRRLRVDCGHCRASTFGEKRTFTLETCRKRLAERLIAPTANA
jgi:hypothetical protein